MKKLKYKRLADHLKHPRRKENKEKEKTEIAQKEEVINDREENMKKEIDGLHKMYKNKYDELVKLTQEIQEEGKKWRELYYRNVKK